MPVPNVPLQPRHRPQPVDEAASPQKQRWFGGRDAMKLRLRRGWSLLRLVFALAVVGLAAVLLYEPMYFILYPTHYAKSRAKPPKWKHGKVKLSNSCDLLPERAAATELRDPSRVYICVQSLQTRLVLSTILRSEGSCDAIESGRIVFVGSVDELPSTVQRDELLVVFYEHPIDAHLAAVVVKEGKGPEEDCSCGQLLLVGHTEAFHECYEEMLDIKHCQHVFHLPGEEREVVNHWLSLVRPQRASKTSSTSSTTTMTTIRRGDTTTSPSTSEFPDRLLVLDESRMSMSTRVLMRLLPEYFSHADVVYQIPGQRDQLVDLDYRTIGNMIARGLYDNNRVLEFYDDVMARRFWKAVDLAGYSTERNMYCY